MLTADYVDEVPMRTQALRISSFLSQISQHNIVLRTDLLTKRAVPCGWAAFLLIYFISKMLLNIYGEITSSLEETLETLTLNSNIHLKRG